MAVADPAKPTVSSTIKLTCGPNSNVTGASRTPGSSIGVFHMRFTPCGAFMAAVTRSGSLACAIAVAS